MYRWKPRPARDAPSLEEHRAGAPLRGVHRLPVARRRRRVGVWRRRARVAAHVFRASTSWPTSWRTSRSDGSCACHGHCPSAPARRPHGVAARERRAGVLFSLALEIGAVLPGRPRLVGDRLGHQFSRRGTRRRPGAVAAACGPGRRAVPSRPAPAKRRWRTTASRRDDGGRAVGPRADDAVVLQCRRGHVAEEPRLPAPLARRHATRWMERPAPFRRLAGDCRGLSPRQRLVSWQPRHCLSPWPRASRCR